MRGPTCIFWANLTPFSLQTALEVPVVRALLRRAAELVGLRGVGLGLGRIVALYNRSTTLYQIR